MRRVVSSSREHDHPSEDFCDISRGSNARYHSSIQISLIRAPLMPFLHVDAGPSILFKPFKSPLRGHTPGVSEASLIKTLGCRLKSSNAFSKHQTNTQFKLSSTSLESSENSSPPASPLVLYTPSEDQPNRCKIEVTPILTRWLREHQRQGVKFVFDCLMGLKGFNGEGCILADDMGLGKTLQSITVMWTLLQQGFYGKPAVEKAVIICPASLVNNWASEIEKWLGGKCICTAVADSSKDKVMSKFEGFKYDRQSKVLISSYETFRMYVDKLDGVPVGLVICDEAHRLKNDRTKTALAISGMKAQKRLLLSGTPIQNDLDEFYSLVSLCNPNILGEPNHFRKTYANPIVTGREPDATELQQEIAAERLTELSNITNSFILRRTNSLLAKVLPPKIIMNVFCRLTPIQSVMYQHFLESKSCRKLLLTDASHGVTGRVLSSIQGLMKLCNHPSLLRVQSQTLPGFESCNRYLDEIEDFSKSARVRTSRPDLSGKLLLLSRLLKYIRKGTTDRVVLISNYTQTLDMVDRLCKENNYPSVRLDGGTSVKKRHGMVTAFNDLSTNNFVFLLSSKAGGCGINLIGANRLVMYDPDWNPANDKQALARVWRDGQKKPCYIYRLFSTGTIEEKIFQRQICKDGLSSMIVNEGENLMKDSLSSEAVKNLFYLNESVASDTHEMLKCTRCFEGSSNVSDKPLPAIPQLKNFNEDDLLSWAHHHDMTTLPDKALQAITNLNDTDIFNEPSAGHPHLNMADDFQPVSFVMSCKVDFQETATEKPSEETLAVVKRVCKDTLFKSDAPKKMLEKKVKKSTTDDSSDSSASDDHYADSEEAESESDNSSDSN